MGNLCPCFRAADADNDNDRLITEPEPPTDRTSLLGDDPAVLQREKREYGATLPNHKQENSAWNRTLEKMASDVIDVSTLEISANPMEQNEWLVRSRMYEKKVANSRVGSILKNTYRPKSLPKIDLKKALDIALQPTSDEDLALIREYSEAALQAVRTGFVIRSDEELIVQFDP